MPLGVAAYHVSLVIRQPHGSTTSRCLSTLVSMARSAETSYRTSSIIVSGVIDRGTVMGGLGERSRDMRLFAPVGVVAVATAHTEHRDRITPSPPAERIPIGITVASRWADVRGVRRSSASIIRLAGNVQDRRRSRGSTLGLSS